MHVISSTRTRTSGKISAKSLVVISVVTLGLACAVLGVRWFVTPVVSVTRVTTGPVVQAFYATGTVQPRREYPIKSNTAGVVSKVLVDKGDSVQPGQLLAVVTDPELVFQQAKATAELEEKRQRINAQTSPVLIDFEQQISINQNRVDIAKREFDRLARLGESAAASSVDADRAMDRLQALEAERSTLVKGRAAKLLELQRELSVAQAAVDIATWQIEQASLKATVAGVVLDRPTTPGTRVAVNDVLMRIADVAPANLVMRAAVDEEDVVGVRAGQTVRMSLYAFPGRRVNGHVERVYDEADKDRRTFEIDIRFDAPDARLASGMTGELAFVMAEKESAEILPATALQQGAIMAVRAGRLVKLDATIGVRSFDRVEISNVGVDEQIVVSPLGSLTPGQRVRTQDADLSITTQQPDPVNKSAATIKAF